MNESIWSLIGVSAVMGFTAVFGVYLLGSKLMPLVSRLRERMRSNPFAAVLMAAFAGAFVVYGGSKISLKYYVDTEEQTGLEPAVVSAARMSGDSIEVGKPYPAKAGREFTGWVSEDGALTNVITKAYLQDLPEDAAVRYDATFTDTVYSVTYDLNKGDGPTEPKNNEGNITSFTMATEDFLLLAPSRDGYSFTGWSQEDGTAATIIPKGTTSNRTFTANWALDVHTITYNGLEDGDINPNTNEFTIVDVFESALELEDASRAGYDFTGWEPAGGVPQGCVTDCTFTATWEQSTYAISYDMGEAKDYGATNALANPSSYTVDTQSDLQGAGCAGFAFKWWLDKNGNAVKTLKGLTGDLALTAKWEVVQFKITYENAEAAMHGNPASFTVKDVWADGLTFGEAQRDGWRFEGWTPAKLTKDDLHDCTVSADWTRLPPEGVTIVDGDGQKVEMGESTYTVDPETGAIEIHATDKPLVVSGESDSPIVVDAGAKVKLENLTLEGEQPLAAGAGAEITVAGETVIESTVAPDGVAISGDGDLSLTVLDEGNLRVSGNTEVGGKLALELANEGEGVVFGGSIQASPIEAKSGATTLYPFNEVETADGIAPRDGNGISFTAEPKGSEANPWCLGGVSAFVKDGQLTLAGEGTVSTAPWAEQAESISKVAVKDAAVKLVGDIFEGLGDAEYPCGRETPAGYTDLPDEDGNWHGGVFEPTEPLPDGYSIKNLSGEEVEPSPETWQIRKGVLTIYDSNFVLSGECTNDIEIADGVTGLTLNGFVSSGSLTRPGDAQEGLELELTVKAPSALESVGFGEDDAIIQSGESTLEVNAGVSVGALKVEEGATLAVTAASAAGAVQVTGGDLQLNGLLQAKAGDSFAGSVNAAGYVDLTGAAVLTAAGNIDSASGIRVFGEPNVTGANEEYADEIKSLTLKDGAKAIMISIGARVYMIEYVGIEKGDANDNPATYTNSTVDIVLKAPVRKGWEFGGWQPSGVIAAGTEGDLSVTANWEIVEYDIGYDFGLEEKFGARVVDGGKLPQTYTVTDEVEFAACECAGFEFIGWNPAQIVKGTIGDVTAVAQWETVEYVITYEGLETGDLNPNRGLYTIFDVIDGDLEFAPAVRDGDWEFLGWEPAAVERGSSSNLTVVASWRRKLPQGVTVKDVGGSDVNPGDDTFTVDPETGAVVVHDETGSLVISGGSEAQPIGKIVGDEDAKFAVAGAVVGEIDAEAADEVAFDKAAVGSLKVGAETKVVLGEEGAEFDSITTADGTLKVQDGEGMPLYPLNAKLADDGRTYVPRDPEEPITFTADEPGTPGNPWIIATEGGEATASVSADGVLTIEGEGTVTNAPWAASAPNVQKVVVADGELMFEGDDLFAGFGTPGEPLALTLPEGYAYGPQSYGEPWHGGYFFEQKYPEGHVNNPWLFDGGLGSAYTNGAWLVIASEGEATLASPLGWIPEEIGGVAINGAQVRLIGDVFDGIGTEEAPARWSSDGNEDVPDSMGWWHGGYFEELVNEIPVNMYFNSTDLMADATHPLAELGLPTFVAGEKTTLKAEGFPKGLKLVKISVKEGKKVVGYDYRIEGTPTETLDYDVRRAYVRMTDAAKKQTLWALKLRILPQSECAIDEQLREDFPEAYLSQTDWPGEADRESEVCYSYSITNIWPGVVENPKEWSFKGLPSGMKYTTKKVTKKNKDKTTSTLALPYEVYGKPTKAGRFTVTATHTWKVGKTSYKDIFTAQFVVWGDAAQAESQNQWYADSYATIDSNLYKLTDFVPAGIKVTKASGLPSGIKYAAKATATISAGQFYGKTTKSGTFAIALTCSDKVKRTFLWTFMKPMAPELDIDLNGSKVINQKLMGAQGAVREFAIETDLGAKVTAKGLPTGIKLVLDKKTGLYSLKGTATKAGNYVVTLTSTYQGVKTIKTIGIAVQANPFAGTYKGVWATFGRKDDLSQRLGTVELSMAAAGTLKMTVVEGKAKYTASLKNYVWDEGFGGSVSGLVMKASKSDVKSGYANRIVKIDFTTENGFSCAAYQVFDAMGNDLSGDSAQPVHLAVKKSDVDGVAEVAWPSVQTYVFMSEFVDSALATVSTSFDAKKSQATVKGVLFDGTKISGTAKLQACMSGDSLRLQFAPVSAVDKSGTTYVFVLGFTDDCGETYNGYLDKLNEDGVIDEALPAFAIGNYVLGKAKIGQLLAGGNNQVKFDCDFGNGEFGWVQFDASVNSKNELLVYDLDAAVGSKAIATIKNTVDKSTGAVSFSITSKQGDKAKYTFNVVWVGERDFRGTVIKSWKVGKASVISYGSVQIHESQVE